MKSPLLALTLCVLVSPSAWAQTTQLNGNSLLYRSTGSSSGSAWTLDRDGYLGTYITLAAPGNVTVNVQAAGTASGGVNPHMNVVIADSQTGFDVKAGTNNYSSTYSLPAGTFFVRTQFDNDLALTSRSLKINSLSITGAKVVNSATSANALAASDTYIANYRKGSATVDLSALGLTAGTQVGVSLKRIAFNFGNAVPGTNGEIGNYLGSNGTAQQTNYQSKLLQNFNAITIENGGKWANTEATRGKPTLSGVDTYQNFAAAHNLYSRYHALMFDDPGNDPGWVDNLRSSAVRNSSAKTDLRNAITSRINYLAQRISKAAEIDIENESYQDACCRGNSSYWKLFGASGIASIFNQVKQVAPNTKLGVNEYQALIYANGNAGGYFSHIEELQQAAVQAGYGKVVGNIGTEDYPWSISMHNPSDIFKAMQTYAVSGLPHDIPEFGVFGGVSRSDAAKILGDTMRLEFGNPLGTGMFIWGFQAENGGGNLFAPAAALYTVNTSNWNNWTITEAGKKWQDLLGIQDWDGNTNNGWTTQLTATAAADGTINFNGYYGDYQLTIGGKSYALSFVKGTSRYTITPVASAPLRLSSSGMVPEPSSILLILIGGTHAALLYRRRRE